MRARNTFATAIVLSLLAAAVPAKAQVPLTEGIQIGLSTDNVSITAGFSGADLTIFGSLENPDPLVARQGRYDIIVVLEGPPKPVVVRRKDRVLGVWVNLDSETFENVPVSYSVATTRPLQDITEPNSYKQLSLGASNLYMQPADAGDSPATIQEFTAALRERKSATGLYSENVGGVQFLSQNLFRATVRLAPNVPVGTHKARAFLFKSGLFIKESSAQLEIRKSGFEQSIFRVAHTYSFLYGVFAISLAMLTGWLGRLIFRRD
ncbi:TIGR02186 family protein [Mesorhizobium sp. M7A.F.Ca.US.008.03.1.1]|uniref:TIGR02186 family protein n=1 Tax=Mesorhizobium sp. M7A.F.Ca.US.008.03.1.1 TaxID=2496742 RepID=UPI000FCA3A21|nr:TIGR02186 family protein [Mesorhizobium sp. M7A.F.Ca.US.008.03.1.1]RUW62876.1 TIGR02186 family protein [Mesorhizobium sp. M7A.F.Ca.US.008.03.1.1]